MTKGKLYEEAHLWSESMDIPSTPTDVLDEAKKKYLALNHYDEFIHKWFVEQFGDESS